MTEPRRPTASDPAVASELEAAGTIWRTRDLWLLLGITVVGAALRLFHVEQWSLSAAEAETWRSVTLPFDGSAGFFASEASRYPLVFVTLRWLFEVGILPAQGEGWLRLPFVFVGMLVVPLFALVASRIVARTTALVAAALLAIHPWHTAMSQTAVAQGVALFFALAALAVVPGSMAAARSRWCSFLLFVILAGVCHPIGWLTGLVVALVVSCSRWPAASRRGRAGIAVACGLLLVVPVWWASAHAPASSASGPFVGWLGSALLRARVPLVLCSLAGLLLARPWPWQLACGVAVPGCVLAFVAAVGGPVDVDHLVLVLPPLLLLAVAAGLRCLALVRAFVGGSKPGALVAGALVPLSLGFSLAVDTFLQITFQQGQRAPWRAAKDAALNTVAGRPGLLVGAGAGAPILTCYLRPNHWRDPSRDAHPGIGVRELAPDRFAAATAELGADPGGGSVVLVLRYDELQLLTAQPDCLRAFQLVQVLTCSLEARDETLYVFHRVAAR